MSVLSALPVCRFCDKAYFLVREVEAAVGSSLLPSHADTVQQLQSSLLKVFKQVLELLQGAGHMGKCRLLIQAGTFFVLVCCSWVWYCLLSVMQTYRQLQSR